MSIIDAQLKNAELEIQAAHEKEDETFRSVYESGLEKAQMRGDSEKAEDYSNRIERLEQRGARQAQEEQERETRRLENQQKIQENRLKTADEQLSNSYRDHSNGTFKSDYWINKRESEAKDAANKLEKLGVGGNLVEHVNEKIEKYDRLEKQKRQQEEHLKKWEQKFEKAVEANAAGNGSDYWTNKTKKEVEDYANKVEKTNSQMSNL